MAKSADPNRLPPEILAELIGVPRLLVEADIRDGAPTNADGTLSLVVYLAWLLQEESRGGG